MIQWIPSFLDEMEKLAGSLTKDEQRRQALQFGALGTLSGPVVSSAVNYIQRGKMLPAGVKSVPRYVAGSMAGGALISGAIPAVRHALERNMQRQARLRRQQEAGE